MNQDQDRMITAFGPQAGATLDPANLPNRIQLFVWGENPSDKGSFTVNSQTAAALRKQIDGGAYKRVVIDFDHQSDPNSPTFLPSPRHHAGYGDVEVVENEGVFLSAIEWTPKGREYAPDYQDVSPVAIHTKADRVILGISAVSLVPNGALHGRTLFSANLSTEPTTKENSMADDAPATTEPAQTPSEAKAAFFKELESLKASIDSILAELSALKSAEAASALTAQTARLDEQQAQIAALAAGMLAQRKENLIQMAALQGKAVTLPETAVTAMSVEDLATHIGGLGATVPLHRHTPKGGDTQTATTSLAAQQNALLDSIRKSSGETRFEVLWASAKAQSPDLFK